MLGLGRPASLCFVLECIACIGVGPIFWLPPPARFLIYFSKDSGYGGVFQCALYLLKFEID